MSGIVMLFCQDCKNAPYWKKQMNWNLVFHIWKKIWKQMSLAVKEKKGSVEGQHHLHLQLLLVVVEIGIETEEVPRNAANVPVIGTEKREIVTNTPEKDGGIEAVKKNAVDGTVVDRGRVIDPDLENVERGESDRETGSVEIVMKEIAGIANATEKKDMNESEGGIEMERGIKVRGKIPVKRALPLRTPKLPKQTPCEPN